MYPKKEVFLLFFYKRKEKIWKKINAKHKILLCPVLFERQLEFYFNPLD